MKRRIHVWALHALVAATAVAGVSASAAGAHGLVMCGLTGVQTGPTTCEYSTIGEDTYVVPAGVASVEVTAVGGRGGVSNYALPVASFGALVDAHVPLTGQTSLTVRVAGNGLASAAAGVGGLGGYNGGGNGGDGGQTSPVGMPGGGGGASDVRAGAGLETRLVVAAGGGGAGGGSGGYGSAGGNAGSDGAPPGVSASPGLAGTASAGGAGGAGLGVHANKDGQPGTAGDGGLGGDRDNFSGAGGGGGGGYFGGGGGGGGAGNWGGGGGGGGSSYVAPGAYESTVGADSTGTPKVTVRGIIPAPQTISFTSSPPALPVVGDPAYEVSATATSSLPVTFSADASSVGCSVSGSTVTFIAAGQCVINADQAGDAEWAPAPTEQQSFAVNKASQTISFDPLSGRDLTETPITVSATASSGLDVAFSTSTPGVCTSGGTNGSEISLVATGTCTVDADQAGDAVYDPASTVSQSFGVSQANQTITFDPLSDRTLVQTPFMVSATASSGLDVTFSTSTPGVCTSGGTGGMDITLVATGTCTVEADQPGDATYTAAPTVVQSFAVTLAPQTITFPPIANRTVLDPPFTVSATASSGLTVMFSSLSPDVCESSGPNGSSITPQAVGTCRIRARQTGDATYDKAPTVTRSFTVSKVNQSISFSAPANRTVVDTPFDVSATASSGLPVSFTSTSPSICTTGGTNGATITLLAVGTCTLRADQAGDATYNAAPPRIRSFMVTKANQTITFPKLSKRKLSQSPVTASATASSGLTVSFTTTTPAVCTAGGANGATITLVSVGTCTVVADQPGDANYNAAPSFSRSFPVNPG